MSKQRFRLKELYQKGPNFYHATFDHITHKINQQHKKIPVILLRDLYLVDENDKKIALRKSNDFIDAKGRHIASDHVWIKLTKPWFDLGELIQGDEVFFSAEVDQYRINRDDVLNKREIIWQNAVRKNDQIYHRWQKYTDTHRRKNFQLSLNKMKQKQKNNLAKAKEEQEKLALVDYSLKSIKKPKLVKKTDLDYEREKYSYDFYKKQGYKYSAWIAARSINYIEGHIK